MENNKEILGNEISKICRARAQEREIILKALVKIGIDITECYFDQNDNLIIPVSEIQKRSDNTYYGY